MRGSTDTLAGKERNMPEQHESTQASEHAEEQAPAALVDEALVEEVSIDGMCGVY